MPRAGHDSLGSNRRRGFCGLHPVDDMVEAANVIEQARPDVLVYLARVGPPDPRAGRRRLARVVLVFGHGHPLTSGLDTVDYFVPSSRTSGPDAEPGAGGYAINAEAAVFFDDDSMVLGASRTPTTRLEKRRAWHLIMAQRAPPYDRRARGDGAQKYEEQLVV